LFSPMLEPGGLIFANRGASFFLIIGLIFMV
jgi:hypothetical protein